MRTLNLPRLDDSFPLPLDAPFTRTMAREVGVTDTRLHRLAKGGLLRRLLRPVYVAALVPDTVELRLAALRLIVPDGCFVTDYAAAWLHAGDRALPPNAHLAVLRPQIFRPAGKGRLRNQIAESGERTLAPSDLMEIGGLLVTTPLRTACDLGRQRNPDLALHGLDTMLSTGTFDRDALVAELPRYRGERWVRTLRPLAPLADGQAASLGESALRRRWVGAGLPQPQCQIPIEHEGRIIYYLDMGNEEALFAAEYDGRAWHSTDVQVARDEGRRGWLDETRHWWIEVFVDSNVFGQRQDAEERLRAAWLKRRQQITSGRIIIP